jgi:hypothetical protein
MKKTGHKCLLLVTGIVLVFIPEAQEKPTGGASAQELAKKLSNPVANLISVPLQSNLDYGIGTYNGSKLTLNIQPVFFLPLVLKIIGFGEQVRHFCFP